MPSKRPRVLVADDDPGVRKLVESILALEGYEVILAKGGKEALLRAQSDSPDVILLDVMMPEPNGWRVCEAVRSWGNVPVIMLTAKTREEEMLKGFEIGADDYVTKPFRCEELIARVKAVLRRSRFPEDMPRPPLTLEHLTVDFESHSVMVEGQEVSLTPIEYKLLVLLLTNAGRVLTHDYLLNAVWGEEYVGDTHLLQVAISRLRKKVESSDKSLIKTKVGVGYTVDALL